MIRIRRIRMKMIKYENDKKKMIKDKDNEEGG